MSKHATATASRTRKNKAGVRKPRGIRAKIYVQDPQVAEETAGKIGLEWIELDGEPWLEAGPMSPRFRVVDTGGVAKPNRYGTGFSLGRKGPLENRKFRQVNAWAIVTRLLALLESPRVFGRRIPWGFNGERLEIRPHHFPNMMNAEYDKEAAALRFGYDERQKAFTCLSHDVVAHEFGHAVLHGLKPYYDETATPDQDAFHEYFGDAIAMFAVLTMSSVLKRSKRKRGTRKTLQQDLGFVTKMMEQMGTVGWEGEQRFERTFQKKLTAKDLDKRTSWTTHLQQYKENKKGKYSYPKRFEAYEGATMLSCTAREIFLSIFDKRRKTEDNDKALRRTAEHTSKMLLRALDYCPPVGLTYSDYALAILKADAVAYPRDDNKYREVVKAVFKRQRIEVAPERELTNQVLGPYNIDDIASSKTDVYRFIGRNRVPLGIPENANDFTVIKVYETRKQASDGRYSPREVVLEFVWKERIPTEGEVEGWELLQGKGKKTEMWCGGTLVFDTNGNVLHYTLADASPARRTMLLEYLVHQAKLDNRGGEERRKRLHDRRKKDDSKDKKESRLPADHVPSNGGRVRCATKRRRTIRSP